MRRWRSLNFHTATELIWSFSCRPTHKTSLEKCLRSRRNQNGTIGSVSWAVLRLTGNGKRHGSVSSRGWMMMTSKMSAWILRTEEEGTELAVTFSQDTLIWETADALMAAASPDGCWETRTLFLFAGKCNRREMMSHIYIYTIPQAQEANAFLAFLKK